MNGTLIVRVANGWEVRQEEIWKIGCGWIPLFSYGLCESLCLFSEKGFEESRLPRLILNRISRGKMITQRIEPFHVFTQNPFYDYIYT